MNIGRQSVEKHLFDLKEFLDQPLSNKKALPFILIGLLIVVIVPQIQPSDWFLNTRYLPHGLDIYANHDFVYPPWSIGILWLYRFMTASGSRILSVLVLAWLVISYRWALKHFLALIVSPFFTFSVPFSNMDILVLIAPILIWKFSGRHRFSWLGWAIAMSLIIVKPQGAILLISYLLWQEKHRWRELIPASILTALITIPISVVGNPPLVLQWLENIQNPSEQNIKYWAANNISITNTYHLPISLLIIIIVFGAIFIFFRQSKRQWTDNHSYIVLMVSSMLLSPYSSMQSLLGALAFAPSPLATLLHWILTFVLSQFQLFKYAPGIWILLFSIISLFLVPKTNHYLDSSDNSQL